MGIVRFWLTAIMADKCDDDLPAHIGGSRPGGVRVPKISVPSRSTHQECPVLGWNWSGLYWPCSSHCGI